MRDIIYSKTVVKCRNPKTGNSITLQSGQGVRLFEGLFGDAIILGFSEPQGIDKTVYVKVARPHADATCIGTTGPGACVSLEIFNTSLDGILRNLIYPESEGIRVVSSADKPTTRPYRDEFIDLT